MEKFVRDVMRRGVLTCKTDAPLPEVAKTMVERKINALFVVNDSGDACGVLSQTDLVRAYAEGRDLSSLVAEDVMTPEVVTVVADIPVRAAARIMIDRGIHRLLITMGGPLPYRPVGILSMSDIVRDLSAMKRWGDRQS